jgi:hypothetical protein
VLGDQPADAMRDELVRYLADHPKPKLEQLLLGLIDASSFALDEPCQGVEMIADDRTTHVLSVAPGEEVDLDVTRIFVGWSLAVEAGYRRQVERSARPREALLTLQMVVCANPAEYIADPESFERTHARVVRSRS